ncbi:MAG TPA: hypothetical protein ENH15_05415 [Actinobacteria bacterium]|nr:hypothetical protein [Actinomycetota bacterium]
MARVWTYEEKIRLRMGIRFGLLDTEALALEGDTTEELEKAAFQLRAERKDGMELALQRKVNLPKQDLGEQTPTPHPPLRSGSMPPGLSKPDPLAEMLARKLISTRLM